MANTVQSTNSPLTPKQVGDLIAWQAEKESFFAKLHGPGKDAIIQVLSDLQKEKGDQVTVGLGLDITGDGVTGDGTLEGNEVAMSNLNMAVKVDQRRQAIRLDGEMTEQRTKVKLRKEAVSRLARWQKNVDDEETLYHLSCARGTRAGTLSLAYNGGAQGGFVTPDAAHVYVAGGKTKATLTATDVFSCDDLDKIVEIARLADDCAPINVDGEEVLGLVVIGPEQMTSLRNDDKWIAAQRDANVRDGKKNPIFSGMAGMYNGLVIKVLNRGTVKFIDYGATADVKACRALVLFAQAGVVAKVTNGPKYKEKAFDYDNQAGFAIQQILGRKGSAFKDDAGANERLWGRILYDTAVAS